MMLKLAEKVSLFFVFIAMIASCNSGSEKQAEGKHPTNQVFLIGNGPNSKATIRGMIEHSGIKKDGYVVIIPTTFAKNDASASLLRKEFYEQDMNAVHILHFNAKAALKNSDVLAIENASILCILNGNKNQFMKLANNSALKKSILKARENGALIAGIGNGASILGDYYFNRQKAPASENKRLVLKPGLGLLKNTVVDSYDFFKNNKESIRKRSQKKNFVFIGLNKQASVWILEKDAVVLTKSGMTLVYPDKAVKWLTSGDKFSLLPR